MTTIVCSVDTSGLTQYICRTSIPSSNNQSTGPHLPWGYTVFDQEASCRIACS
uniref:Uncharacterized protein n=1 Tax=Zea mays TaxID=4577 RepID=C0PAL2_MAIZE|nr:unknown [Zea mays]